MQAVSLMSANQLYPFGWEVNAQCGPLDALCSVSDHVQSSRVSSVGAAIPAPTPGAERVV